MQMNKQKTQVFNEQPRRKFYSLRSITNHDLISNSKHGAFQDLQRSLNRDNRLEEQPVAEPIAIIPGFQQDAIQGKLWSYFVNKIESVGSKVEKQKVNCREKHFWVIKQQVKNHQNNYKKQSSQIESLIRDKYKQVHSLFQEIKQERSLRTFVTQKAKKNKKEAFSMDNTQKLIGLKQQVQMLRNQVLQFETQLNKISQDASKLNRQWIIFLKNILKGGYYLKQGMTAVFKEMALMDYALKIQDMPQFLDQTSKKCLLQQYTFLKQSDKIANIVTPKNYERSRIFSEAKQSLGDIAKKDLMRQVYKDTKQFVSNLVKQQSWRSSNITLPRIQISNQKNNSSWRQYQKNRITHVYADDELIKAKGILFGWKMGGLK